MTVVQNELDDLKERMLSTEMYESKDTIIVNNPPECPIGDFLGTILSQFSPSFQYGLKIITCPVLFQSLLAAF